LCHEHATRSKAAKTPKAPKADAAKPKSPLTSGRREAGQQNKQIARHPAGLFIADCSTEKRPPHRSTLTSHRIKTFCSRKNIQTNRNKTTVLLSTFMKPLCMKKEPA